MTFVALLALLRRIPWQMWAFLALVIAAVLYGNHREAVGAASRQPEIDALRRTVAEAVASNATNRDTIAKLQQANGAWASKHAADLAAGERAAAAVARERDALRAELVKRRAERSDVYANDPSAAEWGRTAVPAGVAAGLRK